MDFPAADVTFFLSPELFLVILGGIDLCIVNNFMIFLFDSTLFKCWFVSSHHQHTVCQSGSLL